MRQFGDIYKRAQAYAYTQTSFMPARCNMHAVQQSRIIRIQSNCQCLIVYMQLMERLLVK